LLGSVATRRFAMLVVGAFALVTMVLALIGIHGVLSFLAATRTREIGIRVALGASGASVRRLVLSDGATMVAAGVGSQLQRQGEQLVGAVPHRRDHHHQVVSGTLCLHHALRHPADAFRSADRGTAVLLDQELHVRISSG